MSAFYIAGSFFLFAIIFGLMGVMNYKPDEKRIKARNFYNELLKELKYEIPKVEYRQELIVFEQILKIMELSIKFGKKQFAPA